MQKPSCVDVGIGGVLLYELATWLNIITHEHGEDFICLGCILNGNLFQQARFRIHGGVPKLLRIHLSKTFITLRVQALAVFHAIAVFVEECLSLLLGVAIFLHLVLV